MADATHKLIRLLRAAHAGERAAALAYAGHWRSMRDPGERAGIRRIEEEELAHRTRVGEMIAELGGRPSPLRELLFAATGRALGILCFVSGWLAPMWGAGWIERRNIQEYVDGARLALAAGREDLAAELLEMARVEWDHERYFAGKVAGHRLARFVPAWKAPPARADLGADLQFAQRLAAG
jgi:demethoxyubiquinone hydroxylase (CLK1/Coq7/Cat5 family)